MNARPAPPLRSRPHWSDPDHLAALATMRRLAYWHAAGRVSADELAAPIDRARLDELVSTGLLDPRDDFGQTLYTVAEPVDRATLETLAAAGLIDHRKIPDDYKITLRGRAALAVLVVAQPARRLAAWPTPMTRVSPR